MVSNGLSLDQTIALQQGSEFRSTAHEVLEELLRRLAVAFAEDAVAEGMAGGGIENPFFLESAEAVRIQHFRPFITVIAGRISHGT